MSGRIIMKRTLCGTPVLAALEIKAKYYQWHRLFFSLWEHRRFIKAETSKLYYKLIFELRGMFICLGFKEWKLILKKGTVDIWSFPKLSEVYKQLSEEAFNRMFQWKSVWNFTCIII